MEFKRLWTRHSRNGFTVQISCHEVEAPEGYSFGQGKYRWCVYAYIRKDHPQFCKFDFSYERLWQDATDLPFHGGCTYVEYTYDKNGKPICAKVGADYNHFGDEHYTFAEEIPVMVQHDANDLYATLELMTNAE